MGSVS